MRTGVHPPLTSVWGHRPIMAARGLALSHSTGHAAFSMGGRPRSDASTQGAACRRPQRWCAATTATTTAEGARGLARTCRGAPGSASSFRAALRSGRCVCAHARPQRTARLWKETWRPWTVGARCSARQHAPGGSGTTWRTRRRSGNQSWQRLLSASAGRAFPGPAV
jgi:hypothetical protein